MTKVKIYGAGSIGNHLAQASRRAGWEVVMVDPDEAALARTKNEIYPKRYGAWDEAIKLFKLGDEPAGGFDVIFLGTPPQVRMKTARAVLREKPKVLQLEKPICPPSMEEAAELQDELANAGIAAVVGYDHAVSRVVRKAQDIIKSGVLGKILALDVEFRETWKGIFAAHPWLSGPQDSYLGFWEKGGGASGEHSHATNLWQHFAKVLGLGEVSEVSAAMQMIKTADLDYDSACFLNLTTDKGFVGRVVQDVITEPVKKQIRIQGENGFLEININGWENGDLIRLGKPDKSVEEIKIEKKRPDDFYEEILHIKEILDGALKAKDSPISIERGLATMKIVQAAHRSRQEGKTIKIV